MAYAEKVSSPRGAYWRGRYKDGGTQPNGKRPSYATVRDEHGDVARFKLKRVALKAAQDAESDVRNDRVPVVPDGATMTFGQWASTWYASLDLAPRTMARYRRDLVLHLLKRFEDVPLAAITETDVSEWEKAQRAKYAKNTVDGWRELLGTILGDAVPRYIEVSPALRKRGRGKRSVAPEDSHGGREAKDTSIVIGPLTALLAAERMAILSGRDDELIMTILMFYAGLRVGEAIGFEAEYFRLSLMKVQWQLGEVTELSDDEVDDDGEPKSVLRVLRMVPKSGSRRDADLPPFLSELLSAHIARTAPRPCDCHGHAYVFRGLRARAATVSTASIARAAFVSPQTAGRALAGDQSVSPLLRSRVMAACRELGVPGGPVREVSPHWWLSTFEEHFTAAASGKWPARRRDGGQYYPARPVRLAGPWPGTRTRSARKADLEWEPLAQGLTPHGLRHSHKSHMIELRIPEVMSEHRLGHRIPGIAGVYSHPTDAMRAELMALLQSAWEASLDARLEMSPSSPVAVLEGLLRARAASRSKVRPSDSPEGQEGKAQVRRLKRRNA